MPTYTNPQGQTTSVSDAQLAANPTYWNGILGSGGFAKTSDVAQYSPSPSVITSNSARETTQNNLDNLDAATAQPVGPMDSTAVNKPGSVTAYTTTKKTATGDTTTTTETGGGTTAGTSKLTPEQQAYQDAADAQAAEWQNQISQLEQFRTERDALNDQLISNIQAKFANLQRAQEQANATEQAVVRIGGIRSGRERYASEIQGGIMSAAVSAGIGRLADLAAEEQNNIIQAKMAASDEDYKLLDSIMTRNDAIRKSKLDTMGEILKNNVELEKLAQQNAKDAATALRNQIADNRDAANFALDNGVMTPFYSIGGKTFSTATGQPVNTIAEYEALGGDGSGDGSDIQEISGDATEDRKFVIDMRNDYKDAGILLSDTPEEAAAKLAGSRIYADKVRGPMGDGASGTLGFSSAKVEQSFREDGTSMKQKIRSGEITLPDAYSDLRDLYSPSEVSDDAIKSFLGITPAGSALSAEAPVSSPFSVADPYGLSRYNTGPTTTGNDALTADPFGLASRYKTK